MWSSLAEIFSKLVSRVCKSQRKLLKGMLQAICLGVTILFIRQLQKNLYTHICHACCYLLFGPAISALSLESMLSYTHDVLRTLLSSKKTPLCALTPYCMASASLHKYVAIFHKTHKIKLHIFKTAFLDHNTQITVLRK